MTEKQQQQQAAAAATTTTSSRSSSSSNSSFFTCRCPTGGAPRKEEENLKSPDVIRGPRGHQEGLQGGPFHTNEPHRGPGCVARDGFKGGLLEAESGPLRGPNEGRLHPPLFDTSSSCKSLLVSFFIERPPGCMISLPLSSPRLVLRALSLKPCVARARNSSGAPWGPFPRPHLVPRQRQQMSCLPSSSMQPHSSEAHTSTSSSLHVAPKEANNLTAAASAAAATAAATSPCCLASSGGEQSGGRPHIVREAGACWWRPPPPLLVRCLHTSTTAAELRSAFASFGFVRCVLASGGQEQTLLDSNSCIQPQTSRKRKSLRGSSAEGGVGLLWFADHEATLRAVHAAPRVFRGLPCSLHPVGASISWGPLILLQGGPLLRAGHAWRRCNECGSIAFEAAAAAPAARAAAALASAPGAAAPAAGSIMVALRMGEEKQLRIAWAEGRHAVLLELPFRALINRVYVLAAPAADACSSSSSRSVIPGQQHLLLCPEHAPRVTVAEVMEGGPSSPCATDDAASAAAFLLLGEAAAAVSPRWRCVRWAWGADEKAGLESPLLQRLSDCRDLLLPLSPPSCFQHPLEGAREGDPTKAELKLNDGWLAELKACRLLAQEEAPTLNLTEEPIERRAHMLLVSRAVLQRNPYLLQSVSFSLVPFPTNTTCFSCAAPAAAAFASADFAGDRKEEEAQNAAGAARGRAAPAACKPRESLDSSAKLQGAKQKEVTAGGASSPAAESTADGGPFPPPRSGWLLWVELQEMLSKGLLSPPCLFERCLSTTAVMMSHNEGPLTGAPPPLPLLLADPRHEAYALRKALRRLALEMLVECKAILSVSPAARLYALLQETEFVIKNNQLSGNRKLLQCGKNLHCISFSVQ
ncbi:hypothetical protein ACSSS7_004033 [Eimeria intestinalis]